MKSTTMMLRYAKVKLGYCNRPGVKMWKIVCDALAVDGYPCLNGKHREWAMKHLDLMREGAKSFQKATPAKKSPAASPAFLESYEWRRVRMEALKKYGPKCQCCGATPADGAVMNVDHIKPRKFFPEMALDVNNLQILCNACNHGKGNWDQTDWRPTEAFDPMTEFKTMAKTL
jgi:hypothetical protein